MMSHVVEKKKNMQLSNLGTNLLGVAVGSVHVRKATT